MQPLVSIVISNYNDVNNLRECLLSIERLSYRNHEVIVVDCGSKDGSTTMIQKEFPRVRLVEGGTIGIGEAINLGVASSKGELLLVDLNSDDVVHQDFLEELVRALLSQKKVGLVCGKRYVYGTKTVDSAGAELLMLTATGPKLRAKELDSKKFSSFKEVDYAGVYLVKREVVDIVGNHDPEYYISFEDADFCFRARYQGYKILYVPTAIHWHKVSSSIGKNRVKQHYFKRRNVFRFVVKHFQFPYLFTALYTQLIFSFFFITLNTLENRPDLVKAESDAILWNAQNMRKTFVSRAYLRRGRHARIAQA